MNSEVRDTAPAPNPAAKVRVSAENHLFVGEGGHRRAPYFYARASWSANEPDAIKAEWSWCEASTITSGGFGMHQGSCRLELPFVEGTMETLEQAMDRLTVAEHRCAREVVRNVILAAAKHRSQIVGAPA